MIFSKKLLKLGKACDHLHKSQSFPIENEAYWMKPNAHSEMYHDEDLMSNAIPMLEYADFEVEAKHKEVAVNIFMITSMPNKTWLRNVTNQTFAN